MIVIADRRQPGIDPRFLAFLIIPDVGVSHGRQFTGGVFGGVSGRAGAVDHDLGGFIRQKRRGKFANLIRRHVDRAGEVNVMIGLSRQCLHQQKFVAALDLASQFIAGNRRKGRTHTPPPEVRCRLVEFCVKDSQRRGLPKKGKLDDHEGENVMSQKKRDGVSRRGLFDAMRSASAGIAATALLAQQVKAAPSDGSHTEPLENFKFDIENQKGWVGDAGSAKEATVAEFPVSQSIAGVSMRLAPGAIRELHWHALAAEWAYVLTGRCRATVIMPNGQSEISDFYP